MRKVKDIADYVSGQLLKEGFIIQRYDSITTSSVYLKLDYGVCNSVRVGDHPGKSHLKYRYNIGPFIKEYRKEKDKYDRFYYQASRADRMIKKILTDREFKILRYGEDKYKRLMEQNRANNIRARGFWENSVIINEGVEMWRAVL